MIGPAAFAVALSLAHAAWPASPCAGHEQISYGQLPVPYQGFAWPDECKATVLPGLGMERTCEVALHELGHLAGLGHSPNPNSVMYASTGKVPTCETWASLPAPRARWTIRCIQDGIGKAHCRARTRLQDRLFIYKQRSMIEVDQ